MCMCVYTHTHNDTSEKGLISKIHKELTGVHTRKTSNPTEEWVKNLSRLLQGGHTEGPQTHERMLSITSHQRDAN